MQQERLQELIDALNGTCKTIDEALPEGYSEDELTNEDLEEIDQQIFRCSVCEWWFERGEEAETAEGEEERCVGCREG